ncbi:acyltransferase [Marinobacter zhanjiangensis]|uniref:acyltransferase n=1 Tax=Marinobacter zhanjiangensis TaxID=578215 RepID=UPI0016731747|nr:acyltransferase [Marinobacter zhanjiangensis]
MSARHIVKRTIKNLFLVLAFPIHLFFRLFTISGNPDSAFMSFSQGLSLVPGKPGIYLRAAFYRLTCPNTSDEITIGFLTIFSHRDTTIHRGVYIGPQCNVGKCEIGKNTLIGSGVHILSGTRQHSFEDVKKPIQEQGGHYRKIMIGDNSWIGNSAVIASSIGRGCIIGAGSVVTKDIEMLSIAVGNPCSVVKKR